jgi:hypothetical protein
MPNWCQNSVSFHGDDQKLKTLSQVFNRMVKSQEATGKGQMFPLFEKPDNDILYLFSIYMDYEEGYLSIQYETRWAPDAKGIALIANMFDVEIEYYAEELAMGIYCAYKYDPKEEIIYDKCLSDQQLEEVRVCEEHGEHCELDDCDRDSDFEEMEDLLEKNKWYASDIPAPTKYRTNE